MISTSRMDTAGVHNVGVQCVIGTADTVRTASRVDLIQHYEELTLIFLS